MNSSQPIAALFLDIGGVFLTNGWDHQARERAAQTFRFDLAEINARHAMSFDTYEIGHLTLDEYLDQILFYQPRSFTKEAFKEFMFAQSEPHEEMLAWIRQIKAVHALKMVVVSNEGKELMDYRMRRFQLKTFVDFFICSCYVHLRKPDFAIYRLALDIAQVSPDQVVYIDDRPLLAEIGQQMGMHVIQHTSFEKTQQQLTNFLSVTTTQG